MHELLFEGIVCSFCTPHMLGYEGCLAASHPVSDVSGEWGSNLLWMEPLLVRERSAPGKPLANSAGFPAGKRLGLAVTWDHPPFYS